MKLINKNKILNHFIKIVKSTFKKLTVFYIKTKKNFKCFSNTSIKFFLRYIFLLNRLICINKNIEQ